MVRLSKVQRIRAVSPKARRAPAKKTGPLKDNLPKGYKVHLNALSGEASANTFIPKIS